ncbi:MAG: DUF4293 family protein [Bacteroidia bacterium]
MIQRLQSIYLVAIIVLIASLCSIHIVTAVDIKEGFPAYRYTLNLFYFTVTENGAVVTNKLQWGLILISSGIIALALFALLGFKNRQKQMLYCKINFLLIILLLLAITAKVYTNIPDFGFNKLMMNSGVSFAIFILIIYFNWRAHALIQKDDELVKSADRIR